MNEHQRNLPFQDFSPEQAVAFQFRWDKLKFILHQINILQAQREALKREYEEGEKSFKSRISKVLLLASFSAIFLLIKTWFESNTSQNATQTDILIFLGIFISAALVFIILCLAVPSSLRGELRRLDAEIEMVSTDFWVTSGGMSLSRYISNDPLGYVEPSSDPNYMELKCSIAQRCLWHGDYKRDPELLKIVWVRG